MTFMRIGWQMHPVSLRKSHCQILFGWWKSLQLMRVISTVWMRLNYKVSSTSCLHYKLTSKVFGVNFTSPDYRVEIFFLFVVASWYLQFIAIDIFVVEELILKFTIFKLFFFFRVLIKLIKLAYWLNTLEWQNFLLDYQLLLFLSLLLFILHSSFIRYKSSSHFDLSIWRCEFNSISNQIY